MTPKRAIESYYDAYSTWYEGERREGYYSIINRLEFEVVARHAPGAETLEIGCGTGLILERTAAVAKRATGIDLSHGMLGVSHTKGLTVAQATATRLPFPAERFDVVYSFKVLPHVPAIDEAIREIDRVLRPGGVAVIEFYNPFSLKWLANRITDMLRGRRVYNRYDTVATVRRLLRERFRIASFRGVRIFAPTKHFYTWPVIGRLFAQMEQRFCDSWLARLGGYLVVEARKRDG